MRRSGIRVFHAPTVDDLIPIMRDPTMISLLSALMTPRPTAKIGKGIARTSRPGRAVGRLKPVPAQRKRRQQLDAISLFRSLQFGGELLATGYSRIR